MAQFPKEVSVLTAVAFFVAVGFGLIIPAIPIFAKTFGVNNTQIGLIISTFAIARLASGLISGKLVERFGERLVLGVGLFMVSFFTFFVGLATSCWPNLVDFFTRATTWKENYAKRKWDGFKTQGCFKDRPLQICLSSHIHSKLGNIWNSFLDTSALCYRTVGCESIVSWIWIYARGAYARSDVIAGRASR